MDTGGRPFSMSLLTTRTMDEERIDFDDDDEEAETRLSLTPAKRGRTRSQSVEKYQKLDKNAKLEKNRLSARECRLRKNLRFQYVDSIVKERENAITWLRNELEMCKIWGRQLDEGKLPEGFIHYRTSCVENNLTSPFTLQQHHYMQIEKQRELQQKPDVDVEGGNTASLQGQRQQRTSPNTKVDQKKILIHLAKY